MDPITLGLLVGAGTGLIGGVQKNAADKNRMKQEAQMRAAEIEASPWTGMKPTTQISFVGDSGVGAASGGALGGAAAGLQQGQAFQAADQQKKMNEAQMNYWKLMGGSKPMAGEPTSFMPGIQNA